MKYIYSNSTNPYWNLALEQYVFDQLGQKSDFFMLWQNDNSIIVGKNQNTAAEINVEYVEAEGIKVVRRLSGGGAVYHDLGNLNFTFIAESDSSGMDFSRFCLPVIQSLEKLGVSAELSGRNDMTICGKKFSGNAMYMRQGRIMHHGTLMYDSDLQVLSKALQVDKDKLESKGVKSVASRVTNIKPHVKVNMHDGIKGFANLLQESMHKDFGLEEYTLTQEDIAAVNELQDKKYSHWEWNYGVSPSYCIHKTKRFERCGKIELWMDVKGQRFTSIKFCGDFFGSKDLKEIEHCLQGCRLVEEDICQALCGKEISDYFHHLELNDFISLLLS